MTQELGEQGFELGKPALVCRWRMASGRLVMEGRHLRALAARRINGTPADSGLIAWAKQHIEWTLEAGAKDYPDGVLMLIVDENGQAAMTVGAYEPLHNTALASLVQRAQDAQHERASTRIAPETLWVVSKGKLVWNGVLGEVESGSATLVEDLAKTMGLTAVRKQGLLADVTHGYISFDEAFLVSDEHGVVPASDHAGACGQKFAEGYGKLVSATSKRIPFV